MIKLYNTLTKQKEELKPIKANEIGLYVCGMTVYDFCHLGHARVMIAFDLLYRVLQYHNYKVKYVRNITDIDDKIINRARENQETCESLTKRMIAAMHEDFKSLNILSPNLEPKATDYIKQMQDLIQTLIDKGFAYQNNNSDVYFRVNKFSEYGKLSRKKLTDLIAGERVEIDCNKENVSDFVLWKQAKENEPFWESSFGKGRPGWHIECSAMSMANLGETFDIHGGGPDLLFPHHENEIAQSECCTNKQYANLWMHAGALRINGEKMSKSLNNFFTVRDVLAKYKAEVVRFFLISTHYRSPINYSEELLDEANNALTRLYNALNEVKIGEYLPSQYTTAFINALNDDLNSPLAISILFELAKEINKNKDENLAAELKFLGNILGLLEENAQDFLTSGAEISELEINEIIEQRKAARANKDWAKSDQLRDYLLSKNIILEDKAGITTWKTKS